MKADQLSSPAKNMLKPGQLSSRKYLQKLLVRNFESSTESPETLKTISKMALSPKMDLNAFNDLSKNALRPRLI